MDKTEIIERERRFAVPAALGTFASVALFLVSFILLTSKFGTSSSAEHLRDIDADSSTYVGLNLVQGFAALLLLVPFLYLFNAASARSDTMRRQFIGLAVIGPLFFGAASVLNAFSIHDAAASFVAKGVMGSGDHADNIADHVVRDQSLRSLSGGIGIAGALGVAFVVSYSSLHAMRTGLLPRFWGALGVALGVASLIPQFFPILLLWLIYVGILFSGWTSRRPPAWDAGEAIPWPTPGERMAEQMSNEQPEEEEESGDRESASPSAPPGQRRKRKRRSEG